MLVAIKTVRLFLLVLILPAYCVHGQESDCVTPDGGIGICKHISECPDLLAKTNSYFTVPPDVAQRIGTELRERACGYDSGWKVCCNDCITPDGKSGIRKYLWNCTHLKTFMRQVTVEGLAFIRNSRLENSSMDVCCGPAPNQGVQSKPTNSGGINGGGISGGAMGGGATNGGTTNGGNMGGGSVGNGALGNGAMSGGSMGGGLMGNGAMGNGAMSGGSMGRGSMGNGAMGSGTTSGGTMGGGLMGNGAMNGGSMGGGLMGTGAMGGGLMGNGAMSGGSMGGGLMGNGAMSGGSMGNGSMSGGSMGGGLMGNGAMGTSAMSGGFMGNGVMGTGTMTNSATSGGATNSGTIGGAAMSGGATNGFGMNGGNMGSGVSCDNQIASPPDANTGCCGVHLPTPRNLLGSKQAGIYDFPWSVLLEYDILGETMVLCGGALISNSHVVTAAQCIIGNDIQMPKSVRVGEYDKTNEGKDCTDAGGLGLQCTTGSYSIEVETSHVHPDYDLRNTYLNDIALIELAKPVKYTEFTRPVCLPSSKNAGTKALYIAGWGKNIAKRSSVKYTDRLTLLDTQTCKNIYSGHASIWEKHICASDLSSQDTCVGDVGGPLVAQVNPESPYMELVGVTSFGPRPCGNVPGVPGVYTSVLPYVDWIRQTVSQTSSNQWNK